MFTRRNVFSLPLISKLKENISDTQTAAEADVSKSAGTARVEVLTVASIAELRDLRPGQYDTVIVRGYRTAGDGGGGIFHWQIQETLADDDGCILRPNGAAPGAWVRKINSSISVKWWGAAGNNEADDTDALQRAINVAERLGCELYVPAGVFRVARSLELQRIVSIRGAGRATTSIRCVAPVPIITWAGLSHFSDQSGIISDISLDGSNIASEGVIVGWGADFTITRCAISSVNGAGLVLHATQNSYFSQVQMQYCQVNLLLTNGAWNNVFSRCEFNQPADRGYNILSKNYPRYTALTGQRPTDGNSRHNSFYSCVMERGAPTQVIRLEDDQGDNSFISCEIYGGGSGTPQIVLFGNNDYFGQGTTVQRGTLAPSLAFETFGFATRLDGIILIGWANLNWAKAHDLLICNYVTGDGNGSGVISAANKLVSQDYGFANGRTFTVFNEGLELAGARGGLGSSFLLAGEVNPQGIIAAPKGSVFLRNNSEDGAALYVKENGSGPDGWKPK
jgi:hypothetical protein